eukprot:gene2258-3488_t
MQHWTVEDVSNWVHGLSPKTTYREAFRRHEIDGKALLDLEEDDLKRELGIVELGIRRSILRAIGVARAEKRKRVLKSPEAPVSELRDRDNAFADFLAAQRQDNNALVAGAETPSIRAEGAFASNSGSRDVGSYSNYYNASPTRGRSLSSRAGDVPFSNDHKSERQPFRLISTPSRLSPEHTRSVSPRPVSVGTMQPFEDSGSGRRAASTRVTQGRMPLEYLGRDRSERVAEVIANERTINEDASDWRRAVPVNVRAMLMGGVPLTHYQGTLLPCDDCDCFKLTNQNGDSCQSEYRVCEARVIKDKLDELKMVDHCGHSEVAECVENKLSEANCAAEYAACDVVVCQSANVVEDIITSDPITCKEVLGATEEDHGNCHEHAHEAPFNILVLAVIIAVGNLCRYYGSTFPLSKIPYTVQMFLLGGGWGALCKNIGGDMLRYGELGEIDPHLMFFIFLPILIFESAFATDYHVFKKVKVHCIMLAGPGLIICTGLSAAVAKGFFSEYNWGWVACLLFGCMLSATDPVAVVALLKELGAAPEISQLIEGESLLNDGTAIVFFNILKDSVAAGVIEMSIFEILRTLLWVAGGGCVLGWIVGVITKNCIKAVFNDPEIEITMTLVAAYVTFFVAEEYLKVSGVLGLVVMGMYIAYHAHVISPEVEHTLHHFWEIIVYMGNTMIFAIAGMVITEKALDNLHTYDFVYLLPLLGLRFLFHVAGIVVLTLCVNGVTTGFVVGKLGLDKIAEDRVRNMGRAYKELMKNSDDELYQLRRQHVFRDANWTEVKRWVHNGLHDPYNKDGVIMEPPDVVHDACEHYYRAFHEAIEHEYESGTMLPSSLRALFEFLADVEDHAHAGHFDMIKAAELNQQFKLSLWDEKSPFGGYQNRWMRAFDVGIGFLNCHARVLQSIDGTCHSSQAANKVKEHCKRERQEAIRILEEHSSQRPEIAMALKSRNAARGILNQARHFMQNQIHHSKIGKADAGKLGKYSEVFAETPVKAAFFSTRLIREQCQQHVPFSAAIWDDCCKAVARKIMTCLPSYRDWSHVKIKNFAEKGKRRPVSDSPAYPTPVPQDAVCAPKRLACAFAFIRGTSYRGYAMKGGEDLQAPLLMPQYQSQLIEGESLLNDGTAIVFFGILKDSVAKGVIELTIFEILFELIRIAGGGCVLGWIVGVITKNCIKAVFNDPEIEITMTLVAAYVTFFVAEEYLKVSGVLGLVVMGMYLAYHTHVISPEVEHTLHHFWEIIVYIGNTMIFAIAGIVITEKALDELHGYDFVYLTINYVFLNFIRGLALAIFLVPMNKMGTYQLDWRNACLCCWGGLRGAVGLALALIVAGDTEIACNEENPHPYLGARFLFHVAGIVVLTLCVNGVTTGYVVGKLGLDRIADTRKRAMQRTFKELMKNSMDDSYELRRQHVFRDSNWTEVQRWVHNGLADPWNADGDVHEPPEVMHDACEHYYRAFHEAIEHEYEAGTMLPSSVRALLEYLADVEDAAASGNHEMIRAEALHSQFKLSMWDTHSPFGGFQRRWVRAFDVGIGFLNCHE